MRCLGRLSLRVRAEARFGLIAGALLALVLFAAPAGAATTTTHPFIASFDGTGSTYGAFAGLGRVAVSGATGSIYVIDNGNGVVEGFDATGSPEPFTTLELPAGSNALDGSNTPDVAFSLGGDSDVAVDSSGTASDGNVYVDSEPGGAVYAFDATGSYLYTLTGFGDACGVAVDSGGDVWVSDYNAAAVTEYSSAGVATGAFVDTSAQDHPCHIAFDSNDNLYANMWQAAVEKYDSTGAHVAQIDPGPSFAVAVDRSTDHVFVDHGTEIVEYDENGALVARFGSGTLVDSLGVAVDGSTGNPSSGNVVASDNGAGEVHIFGPLTTQTLPDVTTGIATQVTGTTARLGGSIDPGGQPATCAFEYGTTTSYGSTAACVEDPGSGSGIVAVHADLSGLAPGTTYHYRLNGTSADGTAHGLDQTFTTPEAPAVGNETAIPGSTSATLEATVDPGGAATTYHFEYGTTTAYGSSAPASDANAGSGSASHGVSVDVTGLQPSTTYHFRIVATNVVGTSVGGDHSFTTRAAVVADSCPNAQIRQHQGSTTLPECRAWELVSQADKGLSPVRNASPLSADGNSVMYSLLGGAPGTSSGALPQLQATRTDSGWVSTSILPPAPELLGQSYIFNAISPTLDGNVSSVTDGLGTTTGSPDVTIVRLDTAGHQTVLHRFPTFFGSSGVDLAASDDLQHVYASVPETIDASHQAGTWNLYDFGSGTPQLVGTMPGTDAAPTCGLPHGSSFVQTGFIEGGAITSEHWTSTDGSRVFFQSRGDDAPDCDDPLQLYTHDRDTGRSTLLSGPPVAGDPDNGVDRFLQATPDGSIAFLRTATSLTADDDIDGNVNDMDVYRWTAATGDVECITCAISQADVPNPTLVSDDGSHVYFSSVAQFDGAPAGATPSQPNLYVWRAAGIHFIAQADGVSDNTNDPQRPAQATLDGRTLLFVGDTTDLDDRTGSDNGGTKQYYRYDDRDGSVACVSCPPDGSAATVAADTPLTNSVFALRARLRVISEDGSTVAFRTSAALVPEDRNGLPDLYEWHDGVVGLVTSGTATRTAPDLVSLSATGRDIVFTEIASLTFDAQDGSLKLYDARIGGGFAPPPGPPSPCAADQCRGPVSGPPNLGDPSSDATGDSVVKPAKRARFSVTAITAGQRARLARTGRIGLRVRVNRAGTVSATARAKLGRHLRTVAHASKRARAAGSVTLQLRLSKAARARLAHGDSLRLSIVVRFAGAPAGRRLTLTVVPTTADGR